MDENNNNLEVNDSNCPSIGTITRTISLFIVSFINILNSFGAINNVNIDTESIYNLILSIVTIIIAIICWWKNNSFTRAAKQADIIMNELKNKNNNNEKN